MLMSVNVGTVHTTVPTFLARLNALVEMASICLLMEGLVLVSSYFTFTCCIDCLTSENIS